MEEYNRRVSQQPLAERLRPKSIDDFVGQKSALVPNGPLSRLVGGQEGGPMSSVLLWGPPGSGKTTLARLISLSGKAKYVDADRMAKYFNPPPIRHRRCLTQDFHELNLFYLLYNFR